MAIFSYSILSGFAGAREAQADRKRLYFGGCGLINGHCCSRLLLFGSGHGFSRAETTQNEGGVLTPAGALKGTGFSVKGTGFSVKGSGFSPYIESPHETGALAPEGSLPIPLALDLTRQIAESSPVSHL
jgi:hypothetical protein